VRSKARREYIRKAGPLQSRKKSKLHRPADEIKMDILGSQGETMDQTPLQQIISRRRSVRRFLEKPVEKDKILACLEAARLAPSAENVQPWRYVVMDDPEVRRAFGRAAFSGIYRRTRFAERAGALLLVLSRPDVIANRLGRRLQGIPFHYLDIGISGQQLVLQAAELGLGTCWIGWFNVRRARKFFGIPRRYKIAGLIALGYAELAETRPRPKKSLEEIAWFNRFGE
jgi:nitroreductase